MLKKVKRKGSQKVPNKTPDIYDYIIHLHIQEELRDFIRVLDRLIVMTKIWSFIVS